MDWNEDGLKDLLAGEYWGKIRYFRNLGTVGNPELTDEGYLTVGGTDIYVYNNAYPWVDDWNEDGRKDLLVGSSDGRIWLFINVGTNANPVFTDTQFITLANGTQIQIQSRTSPIVADLDGDGLKDLTIGQIGGVPYFFKNVGTNSDPQLADPESLRVGSTPIYPGATSRFAPIDWDGNGTIDLLAGALDSRLKLYLQTEFTQPAPDLDLTYFGNWRIPTSGDTVDFAITVSNQSTELLTFDVWTEARLPDYSYFGPLLGRSNLSLNPSDSLTRYLSQAVPGTAPNGLYFYHAYVGNLRELQVYDTDHFFFHKMDIDQGRSCGSWWLSEWEDVDDRSKNPQVPGNIQLTSSPNPFNAVTTLRFDLPESEWIKLTVFNTCGRKVTMVVDGFRDAGRHEITWDASALSSGIYFVNLQTGLHQQALKLLLTK